MRLAIVVPCHDLNKSRAKFQDLLPSVEPEKIGREYPVLAVRHFATEVGEEPSGRSWMLNPISAFIIEKGLRAPPRQKLIVKKALKRSPV